MMTQETLRDAIRNAMKYVVVVKPAEFPKDDQYCVMEGPQCIVQVGRTYDDADEARKACDDLNIDAAIATMFERLRTPSEGMIEAGGRSEGVILDDFDGVEIFPKRIWQAMLGKFQQESSDER